MVTWISNNGVASGITKRCRGSNVATPAHITKSTFLLATDCLLLTFVGLPVPVPCVPKDRDGCCFSALDYGLLTPTLSPVAIAEEVGVPRTTVEYWFDGKDTSGIVVKRRHSDENTRHKYPVQFLSFEGTLEDFKIATQILELAREHQDGRVAADATRVSFNLSNKRGWMMMCAGVVANSSVQQTAFVGQESVPVGAREQGNDCLMW